MKSVIIGFVIILLAIVLLFLALIIRRKLIIDRKEKKFASENRSDAVAWIYADTALLLEKLGFSRGNGSMSALTEPLKEKFGEEFALQFETACELNNIAMFSSRELDEEHRKNVLNFRSLVLQKVNTEVKWYRRMWLKWGLCLY